MSQPASLLSVCVDIACCPVPAPCVRVAVYPLGGWWKDWTEASSGTRPHANPSSYHLKKDGHVYTTVLKVRIADAEQPLK
ncbi:hypothetical protein CBM2606_A30499 [Cupriavidus taiwanensis]|nr:hypothetical protein CBM2606_A30499 [Cupriavidus taiwanensis]